MIVEVAEHGQRPGVWTKARRNAPHGCKKLGELFADQQWAEKAIILLDWQPAELADSELKHDAVVRVFVYWRDSEHTRRLELMQNFDVNDLFSASEITVKELGWVTEDFKKKLDYELSRIGAQH